MNIKRNIIFSLESRKKNGVPIVENVPIRMRVIFASQRIEFTTGYRIDAAKWDTDKQRVKPGCTNKLKQSASEINTDLLRYYTEIQNIFKEFEVQGTMPTTAQVKEAFNSLHSEKREEEQQKPLTFAPMEVFGEFIKECGTQNGWSDATYEKFAAVRKHLEKFDKELTFETLDEPKLTSYVNFLKDVEGLRNTSTMKQIAYLKWFLRWCTKKGYCMNNAYESFNPKLKSVQKKVIFLTWEELNKLTSYVNFLKDVEGLRNTSTMKQIAYLKWFLRWCTKKGYCMNNAYESFNPKLKSVQKKVIFLTWEELNKLKDYKIPPTKQYLERVRDVFLFCCFSGLRYSDVYNLKRSDIKPDHIEVTTVKTADSLIIELNNHSKAILEKYKDVYFEDHKALPVISNQKMNDYLKELGELAEINDPVRETYYKGNERIDTVTPKYALLGTHAGRRTFICNALALGIPAQVVMKWTGHSDYKAMKPYIDIADNIKANAMNKFNQL